MKITKEIKIVQNSILVINEAKHVGRKGYNLDKDGYCAFDVLFTKPLTVKWQHRIESFPPAPTTVSKVKLEFDFEMTHDFIPHAVYQSHPGHWKQVWNIEFVDTDNIEPFVEAYVKGSIIYALKQNPCELNQYITEDYHDFYPPNSIHPSNGNYYWALRGWLRDRVTYPWNP